MLTLRPNKNASSLEVNHLDEDKNNNCLDNLEWCSHLENVRYGTGHIRATEPQKYKIFCIETGVTYNSMKEASDITGVNYGNISSCCSGRLKTAGGYHWKKIFGNRKTLKYDNVCPICGKTKGHAAKICQECQHKASNFKD